MRPVSVIAVLVLACASMSAQIGGTYTINPLVPTGGTNFASLLEVVQQLTLQGVAPGGAIFEIFDDAGPYNESHPLVTTTGPYTPSNAVLTMNQWVGSSATSRVTFRAAPGESPVFDATGRGFGVFWGGADYVTLEGIEIRNAPYDGVSLFSEAAHGQPLGAIIRRCNIHDCGGAGVCVYGNSSRPQNTLIENNFFWRLQLTNAGSFSTTARFGYVSGRRHDFTRLINNTFHVSTGAGGSFCVIGDLPSGGLGCHFAEISNNIVLKLAALTRPVYSLPDNPIGTSGLPLILDANCYLDPLGTVFSIGSVNAPNFATWQATSLRDANALNTDPLLLNPATGDLHLSAGSPCIDASAAPSNTPDDYDGQARAGVPDIGADEYLCPIMQYETNSAASSLLLNLVAGSACTPAVTTLAQGATGTLLFASTSVGLPWEAVLSAAPLLPASAGALLTPFGQLLNVNVFTPTVLFVNGGATPAFTNLFPGSFGSSFVAPPFALTLAIQLVNLDPTQPDGFALSQGCQLDVL